MNMSMAQILGDVDTSERGGEIQLKSLHAYSDLRVDGSRNQGGVPSTIDKQRVSIIGKIIGVDVVDIFNWHNCQ